MINNILTNKRKRCIAENNMAVKGLLDAIDVVSGRLNPSHISVEVGSVNISPCYFVVESYRLSSKVLHKQWQY
jgi:hypothetical protein